MVVEDMGSSNIRHSSSMEADMVDLRNRSMGTLLKADTLRRVDIILPAVLDMADTGLALDTHISLNSNRRRKAVV
jgi:hypothetical protein